MPSLAASLLLAGILTAPALAQGDPHQHHRNHHQHHQASPAAAPQSQVHASHSHDVGPAGATYDLRWLDAMVQHHRVEPAQVVGGSGWAAVMAMAGVSLAGRRRSRGRLMVVMVLVGISLGQGRGGQDPSKQ